MRGQDGKVPSTGPADQDWADVQFQQSLAERNAPKYKDPASPNFEGPARMGTIFAAVLAPLVASEFRVTLYFVVAFGSLGWFYASLREQEAPQ